MRINTISVGGHRLIDICECRIENRVNEHAAAVIMGHISESQEKEYFRKSMTDEWALIEGKDENGLETIVFMGYIKNYSIITQKGLKAVKITLVSGTYLMDLIKHTRTFQNVNETYKEVLAAVTEAYCGALYKFEPEYDNPVKEMLVQYDETDWEFAKRIAGNTGTVLIPFANGETVSFDFGLSHGAAVNQFTDIIETSYMIEEDG